MKNACKKSRPCSSCHKNAFKNVSWNSLRISSCLRSEETSWRLCRPRRRSKSWRCCSLRLKSAPKNESGSRGPVPPNNEEMTMTLGSAQAVKALHGGCQERALILKTPNMSISCQLHLHPCHWLPTSRTRDVRTGRGGRLWPIAAMKQPACAPTF